MTRSRKGAELLTAYESGGLSQFKNRIINGAMMIDQRNAGASVTPTDGQFIVDRFSAGLTQASKFTAQQNSGSVTPPSGFKNYLGVVSSSSYSVASGDIFQIRQRIEGFNIADLGWGSVNASTATLSFWVRSSLTGTFGGALRGASTSYPISYTINAANTWEYKTIVIAAPTTGTFNTDNSSGVEVGFSLGCGSTFTNTAGAWVSGDYRNSTGATSLVGTNGATFYITGVQLEKGSTATSFDYRPYGTELALCQRYYYKMAEQTIGSGCIFGSNNYYTNVFFPVAMRTAPTFSASAQNILLCFSNSNGFASSVISGGTMSTYGADIQATATGVIGASAFIRLSSGYLQFTSEL